MKIELIAVTPMGSLRTQSRSYYILPPLPKYEDTKLFEFLAVPKEPVEASKDGDTSVYYYPYARQVVVYGDHSVELHKVRQIFIENDGAIND